MKISHVGPSVLVVLLLALFIGCSGTQQSRMIRNDTTTVSITEYQAGTIVAVPSGTGSFPVLVKGGAVRFDPPIRGVRLDEPLTGTDWIETYDGIEFRALRTGESHLFARPASIIAIYYNNPSGRPINVMALR